MTQMAEKKEDAALKKTFWFEDKPAMKIREMDLNLSRFLTRPRNQSFSGKAIIDRTCTLRAFLQALKRLMPDETPAMDQNKILSEFCGWIEVQTEKKDQGWDIELIESELSNILAIIAASLIKIPEQEVESKEDQTQEQESEEPVAPATVYYPLEEGLNIIATILESKS